MSEPSELTEPLLETLPGPQWPMLAGPAEPTLELENREMPAGSLVTPPLLPPPPDPPAVLWRNMAASMSYKSSGPQAWWLLSGGSAPFSDPALHHNRDEGCCQAREKTLNPDKNHFTMTLLTVLQAYTLTATSKTGLFILCSWCSPHYEMNGLSLQYSTC